MKRRFQLLMLVMALLPMTMAAQDNACTIYISWKNATGNGWQGSDLGSNRSSVLKLYNDNVLLDTLSPLDGYSGTAQFAVPSGVPLKLVWQVGDYDGENSFDVRVANGALVYRCLTADYADGATVTVIDDPCGTCWPAIGLTLDSVSTDGALLKWAYTAADYQLELGDFGFVPGYGDIYELSDTSFFVSNLEPGMRYDAYLSSVCDGQLSDPVRLTFTTPGLPIDEFPYFTSFEPGEDVGWTVVHTINQWVIGDAVSADGDFSLYISNDGGQSNAYTDVNTLSYAHRSFNFSTAGTYNISFDWRAVGDEYSDYLRVFVVPDDLANFVADAFPGTYSNFMFFRNGIPSGWLELNTSTPYNYHDQSQWQHKQGSISITNLTVGTYHLLFLWCNNLAENFGMPAAIDNVSVDGNTCPAPTNFHYVSVTESGVELDWLPGATEDVWQISVNGEEWFEVDDHPYTLDGLTPGGTYSLRLRSYCDATDISLYQPLVVTTLCSDNIASLPYTENFSNYTPYQSSDLPGTMNPCWATGYTGTGSYPYVRSVDGNRFLDFYGSGLFDYCSYAILPQVAMDIHDLEVSFDIASGSDRHNDTIIVALASSSDFETALFDTVAILSSTSGYFSRRVVRFDQYTGSYSRLAFIAPRCYYNQELIVNSPRVDNINLHYIPTCSEPDDITLVYATEQSLVVGWTSTMPSAEGMLVEYRLAGGDEWIEYGLVEEGNSVEIAGLEQGTDYEVSLRTYCNYLDTSFAITNVFRTECEVVDEFPYTEQFTTGDGLRCWTLLDADQDGYTWSYNQTDRILSTSYNSASTTDDWAITPAIAIPDDADGFVLSYQVRGSAYQLLLSTDGAATSSFTVTLADENPGNEGYSNRTFWLDDYAGQQIRLAFRQLGGAEDPVRIDNINIRLQQQPEVSIAGPEYAGVGTEAHFEATITMGSLQDVYFEWYSTMFDANLADMTQNGNSLTIEYSGMGIDTVTVIASNNYGSATATHYVVVANLDPITEFPYFTGFEPADDQGWQFANQGNGWAIGTAARHSGSRGLYVSADNGQTAGYDTIVASVSYAFRSFVLDADQQYTVSFDYRSQGEATFDFMRAFLVPTSTTLAGGSLPVATQYTSDFEDTVPHGWLAVTEGALSSTSGWQTFANTVLVSVADTYNLVLVWVNDANAGSGQAAAVDNLRLSRMSCPAVTDLHLETTAPGSMTIGWTPSGSESEWLVEVDGGQYLVSSPHATISALDEAAFYNVSVRAICSDSDTSLPAYARFATGANCAPIASLPWSEDFASWQADYADNFLHPCWHRYYSFVGISESDRIGNNGYVVGDTAYSSTGELRIYGSGPNSAFWSHAFNGIAVLPELAPSATTTGVRLTLSARFFAVVLDENGDTVDVDYLLVGRLGENSNGQLDFFAADTVRNTHAAEFVSYTVDMPAYRASQGRLALQYVFEREADFYYVVIDDISLVASNGSDEPGDEPQPVGIQQDDADLDVALYPNPASTVAEVRCAEPCSLQVVDQSGRIVATSPAAISHTIALAGLPSGAYYVRIVGSAATTTRKLMVR